LGCEGNGARRQENTMALNNNVKTETFQNHGRRLLFTNAKELADFLNQYSNPETVLLTDRHGNDYVTIHTETETLSDGSKVFNIRF
jgi:hypothetical protein